MSNLFEVVDSLPADRQGRHHEILDEFLKANVHYVQIIDLTGIRSGALTLIARQKELPIKVHTVNGQVFLERTDLPDDRPE